jgi:hypothetical protein
MGASSPIAILVETMLANAVEHRAIVSAVEAAEQMHHARAPKAARGTRLPGDWQPNPNDIAYASSFQMTETRIALESQKFKNYWIAKSGAGATKRDWNATWRNWILNAVEGRHAVAGNRRGRSANPASAAGRAATGANAVLAGMGRLAHRLAETRGAARPGDGDMARDADAAEKLDLEGGGA